MSPAAPQFTCRGCGTTFELPDAVLAKYPGWTPKQCRACRDRATGDPARPGGAVRPEARGGSGRSVTASTLLTVADVLDRFHDGPQDGVFTDGSCMPNPGPGGWGAVYVRGGEIVDEAYGYDPDTTNNRMELQALIEATRLVPDGTETTLHTDSNLAAQTINQWAAGWEKRGWQRKTGPIKNLDLVQELYAICQARPELSIQWIRAHAGNRWNEYADALSTAWARDEV